MKTKAQFAEGIPIIKGRPIPESRNKLKYNFRALDIGDAVEIPVPRGKRRFDSTLYQCAKQQGVTVRARYDVVRDMMTVWRIQ